MATQTQREQDPVGYPDFTLPVSIIAQIIEKLKVDIVAQTIDHIDVDIAAQTLNRVNVNIAASAVTLDINIAASAVTLDVNIAASAVTLDVDIVAQTVDLNIKTSGGANIIIDKLTQTAYTERRVTLSNNGATPIWTYQTGAKRIGKFFPRGCRGFISTIDVYCKDAGTAGGTITVYISPHPTMGYIASATVTVPAGGAASWRSATFNRMWNYDSLFIFVVSSSTDIQWGVDSGTPQDGWYSTDGGATWTLDPWRHWFRAAIQGMTVGDVPVSGTLNAIEIPSVAASASAVGKSVPGPTTVTLFDIKGTGQMTSLLCIYKRSAGDTPAAGLYLDIVVDGTTYRHSLERLLDYVNRTVNTPTGVVFTKIDETANAQDFRFEWKIARKFKRSLKINAVNTLPSGNDITVDALMHHELQT